MKIEITPTNIINRTSSYVTQQDLLAKYSGYTIRLHYSNSNLDTRYYREVSTLSPYRLRRGDIMVHHNIKLLEEVYGWAGTWAENVRLDAVWERIDT